MWRNEHRREPSCGRAVTVGSGCGAGAAAAIRRACPEPKGRQTVAGRTAGTCREPMKALILSAGQGSRLLPLTEDCPKCLLPLGGRSILEHQVEQLAASGVTEIVVVTGCRAAAVESRLARLRRLGVRVRTVFNPFYNVADNLASCWMARAEMEGGFLLLNGDTLFEPGIARRLIAAPPAPVTLTIDRKPNYDSDDMKVVVEGTRLREVGKTLPPERVNGESIGF